MKFNVDSSIAYPIQQPVVGNVYAVRGGSGAKHGHMNIIVSISDSMATVLTVSKEGTIVTASNFGLHYFEDKCPIAYCQGLEDLNFNIGKI